MNKIMSVVLLVVLATFANVGNSKGNLVSFIGGTTCALLPCSFTNPSIWLGTLSLTADVSVTSLALLNVKLTLSTSTTIASLKLGGGLLGASAKLTIQAGATLRITGALNVEAGSIIMVYGRLIVDGICNIKGKVILAAGASLICKSLNVFAGAEVSVRGGNLIVNGAVIISGILDLNVCLSVHIYGGCTVSGILNLGGCCIESNINVTSTGSLLGSGSIQGSVTVAGKIAPSGISALSAAQMPVNLGSAANFAVLAGSTVTNTGLTTVNGDLGVSPGTAVTGFPPGTVTGSIHAGDPTAAQAQADMKTAYDDLAGRSDSPILVAGNLGGMTLTPGLYKSSSSLEISSGDLTLDAQGDPNAIFIFQTASTFTVSPGRQVILAGGAQADNIFWQVGTSATFGTSSVIKGNVLADQSISLANGASLEGRALAHIGAVTLDTNSVIIPGNNLPNPSTTNNLPSASSTKNLPSASSTKNAPSASSTKNAPSASSTKNFLPSASSTNNLPSPVPCSHLNGQILISGSLSLTISATIKIQVSSSLVFTKIKVGGHCSFAGILAAVYINTYIPLSGTAFPCITYTSFSGSLSAISSSPAAIATYASTQLVLSIV